MTGENDVCNGAVSEVAGIEGDSEFKARSSKDLSKPELNGIGNHDQANDPEDFYVLVTDVGGSPRRESSVPVELSGAESDALNGKPEGENVGEHEITEGGAESFTLVNGRPDVQVIPILDGTGDQDTVKEESECLEELNDRNGKINAVNGEINHTLTEGGIGNTAITDENPVVNGILVGVEGSLHDEEEIRVKLATSKPECGEETEIKKAEDSDGKIERSEESEAVECEDQNGKIGTVAEAKLDKVEDQLVSEESTGVEEDQESKVSNLGLVADSGEEEEPKSLLSPLNKQETVEDKAESDSDKEAMQDQKCDIATESDSRCGMDKGKVMVSDTDCNVGTACEGVLEGKDEEIYSVSHVEGSNMYPDDAVKSRDGDKAESDSDKEAMQDQKCDIDTESDIQCGMDKGKVMVSDTDCNVGTACEGVLEGKDEEICSVSHVEGSNMYPDDDVKSRDGDKAESDSDKEAMQDQKCDIDTESDIQCGMDKGKIMVSDTDCNVGTACEEVLEGKDEEICSVSHVEGSNMYPDDAVKSRDGDKAESDSDKEAMQDHKCDIDTESNIQCGMDKGKVLVSNADCNIGTACEVLQAKDEEICSVSHVEGSIMYDGNEGTPQISGSEREAGASGQTQILSASSAQVHRPTTEIQISDAETVVVKSPLPVDGSESESFGEELVHLDSLERCAIDGVSSGSDIVTGTVVSNEKEPILQGSELSGGSVDDHNPPISAVEMESEAHDSSAADHVSVTSDQDATNATEVLDSFIVDKGVSNSMLESADVKHMAGGATGSDDETLLMSKDGDTGSSHSVDISMASPEPSSDTVTVEDVSGVTVTKPFTFFVRIPRYGDEKLQEQIKIAKLEVAEKTKLRDSIQAQIQEKRARNQSHGVDYEYAKGEDRSVKKLLKEKRMEIDSLQSVINKAKNATSIEDLNIRIKTTEHRIQHETLPLKEEKRFINEIKQLKQLREQLSSSKCSQDEIQQALEQREQAEERLKILRKELSNLRDTSSKAQIACDEAESKYNVEHKKVKELQAQYKDANDVRQEAYAKFLCVSKELSQKRINFSKFRNDSATATNYAFTNDREALYCHCVNEVENFMELWNGNDEFRKEYARLNTRSTLRRFGTLDGRSLGPGEKPPILPSYVSERNANKVVSMPADADSISKSPTMELKPDIKIETLSLDIHSSKQETESKKKTVATKELAKSKLANNLATVSGMDEVQEEEDEPVKTKEELELIRIAEEIRREEAEAKLKEQHRLEEIAKAKEARERKQRRDEKAQKREELRAKKEAEQKEKEREKKLIKKERKKVASASTDMQDDDASSITCVEISKEEASIQVSDVSTKKPRTTRVMVSKQNKTRSVAPPPSLRNRNRKKWQQWIWVSLISLIVLVLFWLGNIGVFSSLNSKLQGTGF